MCGPREPRPAFPSTQPGLAPLEEVSGAPRSLVCGRPGGRSPKREELRGQDAPPGGNAVVGLVFLLEVLCKMINWMDS